jgi:hypothetical protein
VIAAGAGGAGPGGAGAFPDPPTGSPGELAGVSRALAGAGEDLDRVETGLRGASATLAADWQGYAAAAYHACSDGLAGVAHGGAESFRDCARAVSGYAAALDHTQSEIRHLRTLYDAACAAETAASGAVSDLHLRLAAAAKPHEISSLGSQLSRAQSDAQSAATSAVAYARQASDVLTEFHQAESRYAAVLDGATLTPGGAPAPGGPWLPFEPAGTPGPGFGTPYTAAGPVPGLLASVFGGVIPVGDAWNSPIPGYGVYMDATTPEAVADGDLTTAIVGVATLGAARVLTDLGEGALRAVVARIGIGDAGPAAAGALAFEASASMSTSEERIANILVGEGNQVVVQATGLGRTADFLVNGKPYDVYTPTTSNVNRIVGAVASKSSQVQGGGVIIDLSRTSLTPQGLDRVAARVRGITRGISDIRVIP